jgi:hypothetical protein
MKLSSAAQAVMKLFALPLSGLPSWIGGFTPNGAVAEFRNVERLSEFFPFGAVRLAVPEGYYRKSAQFLGNLDGISPDEITRGLKLELIYENALIEPGDISGWKVDSGQPSFDDGFSMESECPKDPDPHRGHSVIWCDFMLPGSYMIKDDKSPAYWIVLNDEWSPVAMQCAPKSEYSSFDEFADKVCACRFKMNDAALEMESIYGDEFVFSRTPGKESLINGQSSMANTGDALLSPFVKEKWDSGLVELSLGSGSRVLDFRI